MQYNVLNIINSQNEIWIKISQSKNYNTNLKEELKKQKTKMFSCCIFFVL